MRALASSLLLGLIPLSLGACSLYTEQPDPPPGLPISGGTLLVTRDGLRAVASDPDRDRVVIVDLASRKLVATVALQAGDEPGRLVEDGAGRIHVALRRGGAIVSFAGNGAVDRRAVCAQPRGIAYQEAGDQLHVACATGELVTLPAAGGAPTRALRLERDLRDVIVQGDGLIVTRFRAAELLRLDAAGTIVSRGTPPAPMRDHFDMFGSFVQVPAVPSVAYRAIALPDGSVVMTHQRARRAMLSTQPGGYGGGMCPDGPVEATASVFPAGSNTTVPGRKFLMAQLPVDVAATPAGDRLAVVDAGNRTVRIVQTSTWREEEPQDPCGFNNIDQQLGTESGGWGAPVAVQWSRFSELIVQHDRAIVIRDSNGGLLSSVQLADPEVEDVGRKRFHTPTFSGLACASCHPEGREDGLAWEFDTLGLRRTQDIGGGLEERAPYHWSGDMDSVDMLLEHVLVGRMGGEPLTAEESIALPRFLFSLKPQPAATSLPADAVERGRVVFETASCAACHNGTRFTNNELVDVGTGGRFKVPSLLGVADRAPFMHTGCAPTLRDRFGSCGGGEAHGSTANLTPAQIDDLVTYLESL